MKKLFQKIKSLKSLLLAKDIDTSTEEGRHKDRERRIALTALTGAVYKLISTAIPLITIRFTLNYLGDETYGLWATISSFFALFAFADLGLGNGLQTELSRASAKEDGDKECKVLISSAFGMLFLVSLILLIGFVIAFPFIDWSSLMNAKSKHAVAIAGSVVFAIVCSKIFDIPLTLVQRTENALQEGYKAHLWQCLGSILSLALVIFISKLKLGELTMIWASSLIVVVVSLLNMIFFFFFERKDLKPRISFIDKKYLKSLLRTGIVFLILSVLTSLSLSLDNFVVAHVVSISEATPYSIMYKISHLIGACTAMLAAPLWSANGEALERGDVEWVKKRTATMAIISTAIAVIASLGVIVFIGPIVSWLKPDLTINYMTLLGMCLLQIAVSFINPYFMVLNAGRIIKFQIINYFIFTFVSIPLKFYLGQQFGAMAVAWVGALCYIICLIPSTFIKTRKYLVNADKKRLSNDSFFERRSI